MNTGQRFVAIVIGLAGATACVLALAGFLLKIMENRLESPEGPTIQAFYRLVGAAYSDGFVAGFGLCFFLTLLAVAGGTWYEGRRETTRAS